MSDTPETDALREAIDNGAATEAEMTSLAGKLERELVAQEERQAEAGDRCGLLYWEYGFDWPDAMADELLRTREERDQARRELDIQLESIHFHMERVPVKDHPLRADDAPLSGEEHEKSGTPQTHLWLKQQIVCNYEHEMVSAGFARTLERERNEARNIARWLYQHGMATLKEGAYRRPWVKEVIQ